jgi:hypothetical protein
MSDQVPSHDPNCRAIVRTIDVGGLTKPQLIEEFKRHSIQMNEQGERLFADEHFVFRRGDR